METSSGQNSVVQHIVEGVVVTAVAIVVSALGNKQSISKK